MKIHPAIWEEHPDVRSGKSLSMGERASDLLKRGMGTWSCLGLIVATIGIFWSLVKDPGHLNLNLGLSLMAAVQGVVLQISANRGDRIASELAVSTHKNTQAILEINKLQLQILELIDPSKGGEEHEALHPGGSDPESD
jgi:hypothetical protein